MIYYLKEILHNVTGKTFSFLRSRVKILITQNGIIIKQFYTAKGKFPNECVTIKSSIILPVISG